MQSFVRESIILQLTVYSILLACVLVVSCSAWKMIIDHTRAFCLLKTNGDAQIIGLSFMMFPRKLSLTRLALTMRVMSNKPLHSVRQVTSLLVHILSTSSVLLQMPLETS